MKLYKYAEHFFESEGIFVVFFSGTARNCLTQKSVWLVIMLTTVACVMPGLAVRFLKTDLYPTLTDKVKGTWLTDAVTTRNRGNITLNQWKDVQYLQKVFIPLDLFHILLCYSLNSEWITYFFSHPSILNTPYWQSKNMFKKTNILVNLLKMKNRNITIK